MYLFYRELTRARLSLLRFGAPPRVISGKFRLWVEVDGEKSSTRMRRKATPVGAGDP